VNHWEAWWRYVNELLPDGEVYEGRTIQERSFSFRVREARFFHRKDAREARRRNGTRQVFIDNGKRHGFFTARTPGKREDAMEQGRSLLIMVRGPVFHRKDARISQRRKSRNKNRRVDF